TTITMKIGYLIAIKKVAPSRIKALTFSKSAAADMQQRFAQLFPQFIAPPFSTIHSFAFEVARAYLRRQGIAYYILEGETKETSKLAYSGGVTEGANVFPHKKQLLRQIYARITNDTLSDEQLDELTTYISYIKNKML